jgi:hypothetical protein
MAYQLTHQLVCRFPLFISPHRFLTANLDRVIGFVNLTNNKFMDTAKQGVN